MEVVTREIASKRISDCSRAAVRLYFNIAAPKIAIASHWQALSFAALGARDGNFRVYWG
jgi:hypothetical protein